MNTNNFNLYHVFYTVAKVGNISKASKELFVSQPAISKDIQRLEENLKTTLFHRNSRGVTLTPEGELLYEHISSAMQSLRKGEEALQKSNVLGFGHLSIGVSTTLCKYILLSYLKPFIQQNPHIRFTIQCQSTFHTLKLIEDNKIDVGLVGQPASVKNLDFYSIGDIEDVFVASKSYIEHLLLRENITNLREDYSSLILEKANLMLLDEKNITRQYINNYLDKNHIQASQILEVSNMDLLIEFAKIGLGIACVIKEFVTDELTNGHLIQIPLSIPIKKREIGFSYRKSPSLSDTMTKFIEFYKEYQVSNP